jgi:hypothetical protein
MRRLTGNVGGCGGLEARAAVVAPDAAAHDEARPERAEVARCGGRRRREQRERARAAARRRHARRGAIASCLRHRHERLCECVGRRAAGGAKSQTSRGKIL